MPILYLRFDFTTFPEPGRRALPSVVCC